MSVTVCTGWTGRGYDALGEQFIYSFAQHWNAAPLFIYVDNPFVISSFIAQRIGTIGAECTGLADFIDRHKANQAAHGREARPGWRHQERLKGYSFRTDACKFALQLFIPEAAAKHLPDGDILVWFDADVVTFKGVPEGFVESLIGDADVCYLGRAGTHSEIGFWAVRLSPLTRQFLSAMPDLYRSDRIFELREWHSAFVFDHVRKQMGMKERNLTPRGRNHVWMQSPLAQFTDHLKGAKRKALGRSPEMRRVAA